MTTGSSRTAPRAGSPEFGHDTRYLRPEASRPIARRRPRRGWRRVALIAFRCALGAGVILGAREAAVRAASSSLFDLKQVVFEGTRRAQPEALRSAVAAAGDGNVFDLDLPAIRRRLETNPWVRTADVRRRLPDKIVVSVQEREPAGVALVDGRALLVDETGITLAECGTLPESCAFPVLTGLDGLDAETRAGRIASGVAACREVARIAPGLAASLSEVDLRMPDRITVLRDGGGAPLLLSPEEPGRNLRNFLDIEPDLRGRFEIVQSVDLRFRGRIAVTPDPDAVPPGAGRLRR